ncbi:16S rRNA (guanine(966)-N(2))-methyltransferase RsmD [Candidatus Protochlamydia phocaeensis]|uniref:16S rRNA (guanine(966)-N(2))-methyltransferase RsmD n=1 Tax=Candidatus Protochlamydia phocaeensis TaxID=1414722 RepID=UPI000839292C|nr:16S rRNA (guanine(966)-N(2))-methyltransferase RsmD [Candidatus Protochlamydia phocaeensis]
MHIIAGLYRNQRLSVPKGAETRPTASRLRESLFNICQGFIEGARFLDLFAGSGAIGLEALSRGAAAVTFIDSSKEAIRCLKQNVAHLHVDSQCQIMQGQVFSLLEWLERHGKQFDIIFADPPYKTADPLERESQIWYSEKIIRWIDESPLLAPHGVLFVEEDARYQPNLLDLKKLQLKDNRRMGHTALQRYEWVSSSSE